MENVFRYFLILTVFFLSITLEATQWDIFALTGKRWTESKTQIFVGSHQSFVLGVHAKHALTERFSLVAGPSLVLDSYKNFDNCESSPCYSLSNHKVGIDLGSEFKFPLITLFVHGRMLVHSRGRKQVSGKTSLHFQQTNLSMFEGGLAEGVLRTRTVGYNLTSGVKWALMDALSLMLSFELAYEKVRTDGGDMIIRSDKGDTMHLGPSLKTDWVSNNSSAVYMGFAYTI